MNQVDRNHDSFAASRHGKLFELLHQQNVVQTAQLNEKKQRIAARRKALMAQRAQKTGDMKARREDLRADFLRNAQTL